MSSSQIFRLSSPIVLFIPFFVLFFSLSYPTLCCPFTFSSLSSIFSLSSLDFSAFPDHRLSIKRAYLKISSLNNLRTRTRNIHLSVYYKLSIKQLCSALTVEGLELNRSVRIKIKIFFKYIVPNFD